MEDGKFHNFDPKREIMDFIKRLAEGNVPTTEEAERLEQMLSLVKASMEAEKKVDATLAVKAMCSHLGMPEVGDHICGAVLSMTPDGLCGLGMKTHEDDSWTPDMMTEEQSEQFSTIIIHILRAMGIVVTEDPDNPGVYNVNELIPHGGGEKQPEVDVEAALTAFRAEIDQFEKTLVIDEPPTEPMKLIDPNSDIGKWL